MRILTVLGSLQKTSSNKKLLDTLTVRLEKQHEVHRSISLDELPFLNSDRFEEVIPSVERWRTEVQNADLILFSSPEYGFTLPGVVKNAIEWLIPSGDMAHKRVIVTCASAHPDRGQQGLVALGRVVDAVDAQLVFCEPTVDGEISSLVDCIAALD